MGTMKHFPELQLTSIGARVLGCDADPDTPREAIEEGVIHRALPRDGTGIEAADIVVFAVPVQAASALLHRFGPRIRAPLTTDTCSTKRSTSNAALAAGIASRFVGAHPLAGDHRSGWAASSNVSSATPSPAMPPTAPASGCRSAANWRG